MKKRIFIPLSVGFILLNLFLEALTVGAIILFVLGIVDPLPNTNGVDVVFILIAMIFLAYSSIRILLSFKIHLRRLDIATFGDGLPKFEKIQHKCSINYEEIKNIAIIASENDSKNHRIQFRWVSSSMAKKYLEFTLINEKKERMCINYYTKKQIIKMLNYINMNMQYVGNINSLDIEEIMKDWYSYGGYNREDLKLKRGEAINRKKNKKSSKQNITEIDSLKDSEEGINNFKNNKEGKE